ncbi:putative quinol monooxygenase [Hymenobacter psychrophilus]|uniref:Quinol monooxygenase YgiN n=1 Tax=Hymenobacter psychrophilus TaxID=651662 RepID=A0A1H3DQU8_9BACT|nr:putative quinol monooxygenase [Hymenobacter psychrophilus]SDX68795.1 Quinol monooxygenase YgiN [Hymenobacter psychrophilus]
MSASPSTIICVAAEWRVQPGHEAEVLRLMQQAAAAVRRLEPGNLLYTVHVDPTDATHLFMYEQYADAEALQAHIDSDHFQQIVVAQIVPVLTERTVARYALAPVF